MAWIKVPDEHRPLFLAAIPKDKRVQTMPMFGGLAAKVNGHIFAGLFGRSAIVRLSPADEPVALALDGAGWFEPMGDGRVSKTSIMLPESVMEDLGELKDWVQRAFEHAATLPPKLAKKPAAKAKPASNAKPAAKLAKKPAAKKPAAKKPSPRSSRR